ncbi:MAG TPA: hypothetical protein VFF11_05110, partial [Candidatus Binatia bacterium]|nr:hypothetical protein [Candidatus Binatia bacterium]
MTGFFSEPVASSFLVGRIRSVVGSCTLTAPGGPPREIKPGDAICQGDIIETAAGGKVGILFVDGTAFNLSDNARAVVKEFDHAGASPFAQLDVSQGTFAFIAGEMATAGRLAVETPFASIRARTRAGGIGMLSLASLFFAAMEQQVEADSPGLAFLDDGVINFKDTQDYKDAKFGIIELTVHATQTTPEYTRLVDDPSETIILRRTGSSISESHVTNTVAQMLQYQGDQQDALHIFSLGQGPTVTGPGGSGTPPSGPPVFFQNINFNLPPDHDPPPSPPPGGAPGSTTLPDTFVPQQAPPPPINATLLVGPTPLITTPAHVVNQIESSNVSFTIEGLDNPGSGTVTFTDIHGHTVSVGVTGNGTF